MRSSFLDYAMSVIVSRALPDVRDGLKPVHRRILYAMHEAKLQPNRPRIKCARVIGEVMGNYYPHGDAASTTRSSPGAAVLDALPDDRRPGQLRQHRRLSGGRHAGTPKPRLARMATEILRDIDADTVDFVPNYDETKRQPEGPALTVPQPARQRIGRDRGRDGDEHAAAQPRARSWTPRRDDRRAHDRRRPADAARQGARFPHRRDHPRTRRDPRRPTPSGRGRIVVQGARACRGASRGQDHVIVTELPYTVKKGGDEGVIKKIADLVREGRCPEISDVKRPLGQVGHAHPDRAQA